MPQPNDISERIKEVKILVASNKILNAIKRLMDLLADFLENDDETFNQVIMVSANYHELEKAKIENTLSYDLVELKRNKMIMQVLSIADNVKNNQLISY